MDEVEKSVILKNQCQGGSEVQTLTGAYALRTMPFGSHFGKVATFSSELTCPYFLSSEELDVAVIAGDSPNM